MPVMVTGGFRTASRMVEALEAEELDLFGVYVAPISVMLVAAWAVTIALRRLATEDDPFTAR